MNLQTVSTFWLENYTIDSKMQKMTKKYFYDRTVLLLLGVLMFACLAAIISIVIRIIGGQGSGDYFTQYRGNTGISAYKVGDVSSIFSFVFFVVLTFVASFFLSVRSYRIKRQISVIILALGIVLAVLAVIVGNALLALR